MQISVSDAKGQLTDLVKRSGDEIVLTRHGTPAARIVLVRPVRDASVRRMLLEAARRPGAAYATPGPNAAASQDFLY